MFACEPPGMHVKALVLGPLPAVPAGQGSLLMMPAPNATPMALRAVAWCGPPRQPNVCADRLRCRVPTHQVADGCVDCESAGDGDHQVEGLVLDWKERGREWGARGQMDWRGRVPWGRTTDQG
jgi:hypothetical protein